MLERLKRVLKNGETVIAMILGILMSILFWYEYSKETREIWSWLYLIMAIGVSGLYLLLLIFTLLDVVFDVPEEKINQVIQGAENLFNWVIASLFNIVGLLILICIVFYLLGWLASIPAWAVVIIILLIMILIR